MRRYRSIRPNLPKVIALSLFCILFIAVPSTYAVPAVHSSSAVWHITAIQAADISGNSLPNVDAGTDTIQTVLQIIFGIIGAFAALSIAASGLKYITSAGDPAKTSEAKKGIAFALVGLALAISAEAIVAFVVNRGSP